MTQYLRKIFAGLAVLLSGILVLNSCTDYVPKNNEVRIHELSDADKLNPVTYSDAGAGYIIRNIFMSLLEIDFETLELLPGLAVSRPEMSKDSSGKLMITYKLRPEARWDNGSPITAKDVEFSVKVLKVPKVDNAQNKPYYEFIQDMIFFPDDPLKFTFICNQAYLLAESSSGDFSILPSYKYDPKNILAGYSIVQLNTDAEKLLNDPALIEFANEFNSEKFQREKEFVEGCGPYKLAEWTTGQRVVIERKTNWWGDALESLSFRFQAYPQKIIYTTINDQTTALVSLKAGNLDVMRSIKSKDYAELPKSEKFTQNFNATTPKQLAYTYIGLNLRKKCFTSKKTRQALTHLLDVDKMIETIKYGQAQRVIGPIHPSKTDYNTNIVPYTFDPELAKKMLEEDGWKDTNGDGTIDKMIDGERVEFKVVFTINSGNDERKSTALLFQENARKVGIMVDVLPQDWAVYLDKQKKHEFDMFFGAWIGTPVPWDPKQIFHTESANDGSNYVSFGNAESDAVIDSIRFEIDETKRRVHYMKLQEILHDEVPYIFLWAPYERIAIHKKFTNAKTYVMRPGYWEAGFKLAQDNQK
ncbi:MAG: ABC transporter substrate-binding protein [Bacteroidia bacterium]|nr:ABC transporter substrate-binding protein [Bacteroidia bacterium]